MFSLLDPPELEPPRHLQRQTEEDDVGDVLDVRVSLTQRVTDGPMALGRNGHHHEHRQRLQHAAQRVEEVRVEQAVPKRL